jgi:hypothetical protein
MIFYPTKDGGIVINKIGVLQGLTPSDLIDLYKYLKEQHFANFPNQFELK